jgi:hypothetical protein
MRVPRPWGATAIAGFALLFATPRAPAQDVQPVLDLPTLAQGQVIGATAKNQGRRSARVARPTANQVYACAQRPRFRRELGSRDVRLQKLERLCRGVGL